MEKINYETLIDLIQNLADDEEIIIDRTGVRKEIKDDEY